MTAISRFWKCQIVDCLHSDKQTTVEIDKRAFTADSNDTFALPGATLTVTDWNGNVVDSPSQKGLPHLLAEALFLYSALPSKIGQSTGY